jgi:hypothetical protein
MTLSKLMKYSIGGGVILISLAAGTAQAVDLKANFRLFGEVNRFGLGYGDMALHFGVNPAFLTKSTITNPRSLTKSGF